MQKRGIKNIILGLGFSAVFSLNGEESTSKMEHVTDAGSTTIQTSHKKLHLIATFNLEKVIPEKTSGLSNTIAQGIWNLMIKGDINLLVSTVEQFVTLAPSLIALIWPGG